MPDMQGQIAMAPVLPTRSLLFVMTYKSACNGNLYSQRLEVLHCSLEVCTNE